MASVQSSSAVGPPISAIIVKPALKTASSKKQQDADDSRKVRKVRFNPYVNRVRLPIEECEDAQKARKSRIKEAPYHDELWDGDAYTFRDRELTTDELWSLRIRSRVSSLPRKLKNPLKKGLRALQFLVPGSKPVDLVSAHAVKLKQDSNNNIGAAPQHQFFAPKTKDEPIPEKPLLLRRVSSATRGRELSLETDGITPQTFARHDHLMKVIAENARVPEDLAKAERDLALHKKQLQEVNDELRRLRFEIPEQERKLARNANPRLLHYVQFSRDDKVKRLEKEVLDLKTKQQEEQKQLEKLATLIREENERLDRLGARLTVLRGAEAETAAIELSVVQEFAEQDHVLIRLEQHMDDLRAKLEKEQSVEKKLRKAAEVFQHQVYGQFLQQAQMALQEADQSITKSNSLSSGGGVLSPRPAYLPPKPAPSSTSTPGSSKMNEMSVLAVSRRDALAKARDNVLQAVDLLESTLDEVEESCRDQWSSSVLLWRKEIPSLQLPEVFGNAASVLRKRTTSDFELLGASAAGKKNAAAHSSTVEFQLLLQLKKRVDKKLQVVHKLVELTQRYVEFFAREAARAAQRIASLKERKSEGTKELQHHRKTVFQRAKGQVMAGTTAVVPTAQAPAAKMSQESISSASSFSGLNEGGRTEEEEDDMSITFPAESQSPDHQVV